MPTDQSHVFHRKQLNHLLELNQNYQYLKKHLQNNVIKVYAFYSTAQFSTGMYVLYGIIYVTLHLQQN